MREKNSTSPKMLPKNQRNIFDGHSQYAPEEVEKMELVLRMLSAGGIPDAHMSANGTLSTYSLSAPKWISAIRASLEKTLSSENPEAKTYSQRVIKGSVEGVESVMDVVGMIGGGIKKSLEVVLQKDLSLPESSFQKILSTEIKQNPESLALILQGLSPSYFLTLEEILLLKSLQKGVSSFERTPENQKILEKILENPFLKTRIALASLGSFVTGPVAGAGLDAATPTPSGTETVLGTVLGVAAAREYFRHLFQLALFGNTVFFKKPEDSPLSYSLSEIDSALVERNLDSVKTLLDNIDVTDDNDEFTLPTAPLLMYADNPNASKSVSRFEKDVQKFLEKIRDFSAQKISDITEYVTRPLLFIPEKNWI